MSFPIYSQVRANPDGGPIRVQVEFPDTLLLCSYTIDVHDAEGNDSIQGFPRRGDNGNSENGSYELPLPAASNKHRTIWAFVKVIDQSGAGGKYCATMKIIQDGLKIGMLTTGSKAIPANAIDVTLVAQLA